MPIRNPLTHMVFEDYGLNVILGWSSIYSLKEVFPSILIEVSKNSRLAFPTIESILIVGVFCPFYDHIKRENFSDNILECVSMKNFNKKM